MPTYIEREALLEEAWDADTRCGYVQVVDVGSIINAPPCDVVPVRRGKWMTNSDYPDRLICSVCGYQEAVWWADKGTIFCPSCGVKMDGES